VTEENLARFGRKASDVVEVSFSEHYPGNPYTELRLAGLFHAIIGSGSATFTFSDGSRASVCEIFYSVPCAAEVLETIALMVRCHSMGAGLLEPLVNL